jgi:FkbM family methyltransferase
MPGRRFGAPIPGIGMTDTIDPQDPAYAEATAHVGGRDFALTVYAHRDAVSAQILRFHVWQPAISLFLTFFLRPGDVFVDVGAHLGYFSALAGTIVGPTGRVIAFEPDRLNFALLSHNLRAFDTAVRGQCAAIADRRGTVRLFRHSRQPGHHSTVDGDPHGAVSVPTLTLTEALADVGPVRCIKIDVQGAERAVLEGLKGLLAPLPPGRQPFIIVEIAPAAWLVHDPALAWLKDFLHAHRYDVHLFLGGESLKVAPPRLGWDGFAALMSDVAAYNHPSKELDLLLAPEGYWSWLLRRYAAQSDQAPGSDR